MAIQILLLIVGLALILFGANWLVDGSTSIARKTGMSEFVIGLTIVGIGTSTPEMVVSFIAAFQGQSELALGNVIGSNIFNILMILGVTTLISPITMSKDNRVKDIPLNILVTGGLMLIWLILVPVIAAALIGLLRTGLLRFPSKQMRRDLLLACHLFTRQADGFGSLPQNCHPDCGPLWQDDTAQTV